jgi:hypothetical protein
MLCDHYGIINKSYILTSLKAPKLRSKNMNLLTDTSYRLSHLSFVSQTTLLIYAFNPSLLPTDWDLKPLVRNGTAVTVAYNFQSDLQTGKKNV